MLNFSQIFWEGLILSFIFSFVVLASLYYNPRLWLNDYPKDIQKASLPKTKKEKTQFLLIGLPLIVILFIIPYLSSLHYSDNISFLSLFLHFFLIFSVISLVDLLFIDWLIFCYISPKFIEIPGTSSLNSHKSYLFHLIGFLKGIIIYGIFSFILAGIRYIV